MEPSKSRTSPASCRGKRRILESEGSAPSCEPAKRRILLAEDDTDMRDLLTWALLEQGYDVVGVGSGKELRFRLVGHFLDPPSHRFDLVLSDLRMPDTTGSEVIRDLQEFAGLPPTILMTAFGDEEIHREAERLGVLLLDKPFELDELLSHVRRLLAT